ncbi:MAG: DNA repair exonuclease [Corynebacterium sp.]|nr:DNA repair exonuclease [Corynebacterium sp.]
MDDLRFIHTSDWQMGMSRWFLQSGAAAFDSDRLDAIRRIYDLARDNNASFIVAAGDIFDANDMDDKTFSFVQQVLTQTPVPIYLLPGNHDYYREGSALDRIAKLNDPKLIVLSDNKPHEFAPGVEIIGTPYFSRTTDSDIVRETLESLQQTENPGVRILVTHGQFSGNDFGKEGAFDQAFARQCIDDGVVDYIAVGDTHSFKEIDKGIYFSGAPEVTDFHEVATGQGEFDSGNAALVTISRSGAEPKFTVEKKKVGRWVFDAYRWDLDGSDSIESITKQLESYTDGSRTVVKYGVSGHQSLEGIRAFENLMTNFRTRFVELTERKSSAGLKLEASEEDLASIDLGGFMNDAAKELLTEGDMDALKELFYLIETVDQKAGN